METKGTHPADVFKIVKAVGTWPELCIFHAYFKTMRVSRESKLKNYPTDDVLMELQNQGYCSKMALLTERSGVPSTIQG